MRAEYLNSAAYLRREDGDLRALGKRRERRLVRMGSRGKVGNDVLGREAAHTADTHQGNAPRR